MGGAFTQGDFVFELSNTALAFVKFAALPTKFMWSIYHFMEVFYLLLALHYVLFFPWRKIVLSIQHAFLFK